MAFDLTKETLITFEHLAKKLPTNTAGRPVHVSTIHRWRSIGVGGVQLEALRIGGRWLTTTEAFQRFVSKQNNFRTSIDVRESLSKSGRSAETLLKKNGW